MKIYTCPDSKCLHTNKGPEFLPPYRKGYYFRESDGQWIQRYRCRNCKKNFSSATFNRSYWQKKRKLNHRVFMLLNSGVSQRRCSLILNVNPKTVVRKFRFVAELARLRNQEDLIRLSQSSENMKIALLQFDDLETSEHSKCKSISVALAVEPETRKILSFQVSRMPPKGLLSRVAREKYGPRADERPSGWCALFESLKPLVSKTAEWISDGNPNYPKHLFNTYPAAKHTSVKGRRGCVAGQGELKKVGFDPLFSLNHTCAMLRANMNRLFRRTWCTTKTLKGLIDHLSIYTLFHNRILTPSLPTLRGQFVKV